MIVFQRNIPTQKDMHFWGRNKKIRPKFGSYFLVWFLSSIVSYRIISADPVDGCSWWSFFGGATTANASCIFPDDLCIVSAFLSRSTTICSIGIIRFFFHPCTYCITTIGGETFCCSHHIINIFSHIVSITCTGMCENPFLRNDFCPRFRLFCHSIIPVEEWNSEVLAFCIVGG